MEKLSEQQVKDLVAALLLPSKHLGLPVGIFIVGRGQYVDENGNDIPSAKIGTYDHQILVDLSSDPKILSDTSKFDEAQMRDFNEGINLIEKIYDLCLKFLHNDEYQIKDIVNDLEFRGFYTREVHQE